MASYLFGANGNGEKRTDEEAQAHWKEVTTTVSIGWDKEPASKV